MAVNIIDNQVIAFDIDESCNCTTSKQSIKIDTTDDSIIQMNLTKATGTDLITDSSFTAACGVNWTCGTDWTISGGRAIYAAGATNAISQTLSTLATDTYYRIEIAFASNDSGAFYVDFGGNTICTNDIDVQASSIFTVYYYLDSKTSDDIEIYGTASDFEIGRVQVFIMSMPEFSVVPVLEPTSYLFVQDSVTRTVKPTYTGVSITNVIDTGIATIRLVDDVAQIDFDWSAASLNNGCYNIEIDDQEVSDLRTSFVIDFGGFSGSCMKEITWTNTEDGLGFDFTNFTYSQKMRIEARLHKPRYLMDELIFTDSVGSTSLIYGKRVKSYLFETDLIPEFMHDALSSGMMHDTFSIDSIQYVKREGEYSPDWERFADASVAVELIKASELTVNNNCG